MKQQLKEHSVVIGAQETVIQTISKDKIAAATAILRDKLYTDKLKAAITEPLCNAIDEHRKNNVKRPVEVFLLHDEVIIRDYANGLSDDVAYKVFFQYLETTKDETDEQIGGFGLGAKAPGAYSDNYTVESIYNGKKTTFWSRVDGDVNLVSKIDVRDTDLPSGIAVHIPFAGKDERETFNAFKASSRILFDLHTIIGDSAKAEFDVITSPRCDTCSSRFMRNLERNIYGCYDSYGSVDFSSYGDLEQIDWGQIESGYEGKLIAISDAFCWVASRMIFQGCTPGMYYSDASSHISKYESLVKYIWNPSGRSLVKTGEPVENIKSSHYYSNHNKAAVDVQNLNNAFSYMYDSKVKARAYNIDGLYTYEDFLSTFFSNSSSYGAAVRVYDGDLIYKIESTTGTTEFLDICKQHKGFGGLLTFRVSRDQIIVNQNRETASFTKETGRALLLKIVEGAETIIDSYKSYTINLYDTVLKDMKSSDKDFGKPEGKSFYMEAVKTTIRSALEHTNKLFEAVIEFANAISHKRISDKMGDIASFKEFLSSDKAHIKTISNLSSGKCGTSSWIPRTKAVGCREESPLPKAVGVLGTSFYVCEDIQLLNRLGRSEKIKDTFNAEFLLNKIKSNRALFCNKDVIEDMVKASAIGTLFPNKSNLPFAEEIPVSYLEEEEQNIPKTERKKKHTQELDSLESISGNYISEDKYSHTAIFSINEARNAKYGTFIERMNTVRQTGGNYNGYSVERDLLPLIGIEHLAIVPKSSFKKFKEKGCLLVNEIDVFKLVNNFLKDKIIVPKAVDNLGYPYDIESNTIRETLFPKSVQTITWDKWSKLKTLLYMAGSSVLGRDDIKKFEDRLEKINSRIDELCKELIKFRVELAPDLLVSTLEPNALIHNLFRNMTWSSEQYNSVFGRLNSLFIERRRKIAKSVLKIVKKYSFKSISSLN